MTRMRHPNVVSFMGLSLIPPLIVTGGSPVAKLRCCCASTTSGPSAACVPSADRVELNNLRHTAPPGPMQSFATRALCTTCCGVPHGMQTRRLS